MGAAPICPRMTRITRIFGPPVAGVLASMTTVASTSMPSFSVLPVHSCDSCDSWALRSCPSPWPALPVSRHATLSANLREVGFCGKEQHVTAHPCLRARHDVPPSPQADLSRQSRRVPPDVRRQTPASLRSTPRPGPTVAASDRRAPAVRRRQRRLVQANILAIN